MALTLPWQRPSSAKPLHPAGYNAFAEKLVDILIPVGSTALVSQACYVLAEDQIVALLTGHATGWDIFVVALVTVLGLMIDTALIVFAARFKMHVMRGKREVPWAIVAGVILFLTLGVEGMTGTYFAYRINPSSVPSYLVEPVKHIHDLLFFFRNWLPPIILAAFTTVLMPLTFERADRDRQTKATTSRNIAALQEELVNVHGAEDAAKKIRAMENQMALNQHADHATPDEIARDRALTNQLRRNYGLPPVSDDTTATPEQDVAALIDARLADWAAEHPVDEWVSDAIAAWDAALPSRISAIVAAKLAEMDDARPAVAVYNDVAPRATPNPVRPRPGTRSFRTLVYQTAKTLHAAGRNSIFNIAQALDVDPHAIEDAIRTLKDARVGQLRPGEELAPDPALDSLRVTEPVTA